jgi:WD40 repeat protein
MTPNTTEALVYRQGQRLALAAGATSAHWIGEDVFFALSDGAVHVIGDGDKRFEVHDGAILSAAPRLSDRFLFTGGDDGRIKSVNAAGEISTLFENRKWIDHLLVSEASGIIVAGVGKEAIVFKNGAESHRFTHPSTIGGLALDAKGRRLAVAHYGGVTLRLALAADDKGQELKWAGSHLAITMAADASAVVTGMQELELHGWLLPDKTDLKMSGYGAKTKSFSWDKRGRWLATSGADRAVVWPFTGKTGPQGKPPAMFGERQAMVTSVAFHPSEEFLAIGYSDGAVLLARFSDLAEMDVDEPGEGAVTALAWCADGKALAWGDEAGRGGIVKF